MSLGILMIGWGGSLGRKRIFNRVTGLELASTILSFVVFTKSMCIDCPLRTMLDSPQSNITSIC